MSINSLAKNFIAARDNFRKLTEFNNFSAAKKDLKTYFTALRHQLDDADLLEFKEKVKKISNKSHNKINEFLKKPLKEATNLESDNLEKDTLEKAKKLEDVFQKIENNAVYIAFRTAKKDLKVASSTITDGDLEQLKSTKDLESVAKKISYWKEKAQRSAQ